MALAVALAKPLKTNHLVCKGLSKHSNGSIEEH